MKPDEEEVRHQGEHTDEQYSVLDRGIDSNRGTHRDREFSDDISYQFKHRLGKMKLVGERYPYPLIAVHADKFVSSRFALIGDAAVGMHPVTAHGFNLG